MADKRIDQLTAAATMGDNDLLVVQQNNQAKKLPGSVLSDYVYNVVEVSNTQPAESRNKVWIKPSEEEIELAEMSDLDEILVTLGNCTLQIGNEVFKPCKNLITRSESSPNYKGLSYYSATDPSLDTAWFWATQPIPIPETLDDKIIAYSYGYNAYYSILFYDSSYNIISGDTNSTNNSEKTYDIPSGATYFVLSRMNAVESFNFYAKFKMNLAQTANYNNILARTKQKYNSVNLASQLIWSDHIEINPTTGEETYSASSNYSATDYIEIPQNCVLVGHYAYTASGKARYAFYDASKMFISGAYGSTKRLLSSEIPENAKFVRFGTHTTIPTTSCQAYALQIIPDKDHGEITYNEAMYGDIADLMV